MRIVADGFEIDPHELEIGEIVEFQEYIESIPWEELSPSEQRLLVSNGYKVGDPAPARVHVHYYDVEGIENDLGPLCLFVLESDIEIVEDDEEMIEWNASFGITQELKAGSVIEMLEDCFDDGFSAGDRFKIYLDDMYNEPCFEDKDGDQRSISLYEHKVISY